MNDLTKVNVECRDVCVIRRLSNSPIHKTRPVLEDCQKPTTFESIQTKAECSNRTNTLVYHNTAERKPMVSHNPHHKGYDDGLIASETYQEQPSLRTKILVIVICTAISVLCMYQLFFA